MMRRTKTEWCELIEQQKASGLSAAEFCRRESLNPKYFSLRKKQLSEATSGFVELVPPSISAVEAAPALVQLRVIELEVSLNSLASVLKQLRQ
jgi:hypothetical protein